MHWLFTDETNVDPGQGDFFIYGGIVLTPEQMANADVAVSQIRSRYGFRDDDKFKFQVSSRPDHMTREDWTAAKSDAIAALEEIGAVLMFYVVLHDIARSNSSETNIEWALNSLIAHFDMRFLAEHQATGAVCIDRLDPRFGYRYLRTKFQSGVSLPDGRTLKLNRVIHYSMSCDGASHMSSLTDIALGSMRYCINTATGTGSQEVARTMMPALARMMWHEKMQDGTLQIGGYGFIQYPRNIKYDVYRQRYQALANSLEELSMTDDEEE